jgi:hypothetical protein
MGTPSLVVQMTVNSPINYFFARSMMAFIES